MSYLRLICQGLAFALALLLQSYGVARADETAAQDFSPIPEVTDQFRFSVTLSAWAPANQTTGYVGGASLGTLIDSVSDNIQSSNGSAMGGLEVHYDRFGLLGDFAYWDNNNGKVNHAFVVSRRSTVYASAHSDTRQAIFTGAATYTLISNTDWYIDSLLGARYINTDTSVNLDGKYPAIIVKAFTTGLAQSGLVTNVTNATIPIIGFKGRARIADSEWFIPFYGDIGTAGTTFSNTWQAQAGIARSFDWCEINLSYRALYFELAGDILRTKNTFYGPSLGITVNF